MTRSWSRRFVQYHQRVLELDPIGYWLLDEKQGTTAYDWVIENGAQNGTHAGVTLYEPGIGDGRACPYYDGANDYTDLFTASLAGAFDGGEGSMAIWARVANAGVWTDGAFRRIFRLAAAPGTNDIYLERANVNNTLQWNYWAGGALDRVTLGGLVTTDWMHVVLTWSASTLPTGELRAYYNGAQTGVTQVGLGVWAGALAATATVIGAGSTLPSLVWSGWLAHAAVWDRPLAPAEIADLAVV